MLRLILFFLFSFWFLVLRVKFNYSFNLLSSPVFGEHYTLDNGYIITGHTFGPSFGNSDAYVIKTDSVGNIIWRKIFGGSGYENAYSAIQISNGFLIVGSSNTSSFNATVYLIKTDALGNVIWSKGYYQYFGGSNFIRETSDGAYITTGGGGTGPNGWGVGLMKIDTSGNIIWARRFGTSTLVTGSSGWDVRQTFDDGYIISGRTNDFNIMPGNYTDDIFLIKTDSTGHAVWKKTYGGSIGDEVGNAVRQTSDSGYVIAGYAESFTPDTTREVYLVKTDNLGNLLWSKTYRGITGDGIANSVQQTTDGGYIIGAYTLSFGAGLYDAYLIKTDSAGNLQWSKTYGGTDYDYGYITHQTSDGGFIFAGSTSSFGAGPSYIYLIKTDSAGNSGCNEALVNSIVTTPATIVGTPVSVDTTITVPVSNPATQVTTGGASMILCITTGEEEMADAETQITIYPNPAANQFSFTTDAASPTITLEIYNPIGEKIFSETFHSLTHNINISHLPSGIYWCRAITKDKKIFGTQKLIIAH